MKVYDEGSESLHELLRAASSDQGSTLLVPDLQRPYVWGPNQVTLLVDSLLRGWPFGTLLLWSVHKEDLASIPSRPFWKVADRTGEFDDSQVSKSNPPAQFRMVLDGQQRLQSLLLAFGGDNWGFRLLDQEWSTALDAERPRGRNAKRHWSLGHLCLDVRAFHSCLMTAGSITGIDYRDVMSWVVQSPSDGRSALKRPANYKYPIESGDETKNRGRFIRLSRLWELASAQAGLYEKHFRDRLVPLLKVHDVPQVEANEILGPLAELVVTLRDVKLARVSYLQLAPFSTDVFNQDVYNDAIVNIFTRLNTAGRALTRQEITFAWIKTGWDAGKTANRTAGRCFEDLGELLADEGMKLDIDELVGAVSAMWSVLHRKGSLLTANDLLRGEKVRPMAEDLVASWETISSNAVDGARLVADRGFRYGTHYRSLNVVTLLLAWRLLGRQWLTANTLKVTAKDDFEKALDNAFSAACDRWILMSQWSGRWGKSTDKVFAAYIGDLSADWTTMSGLQEPAPVITVLISRMTGWIDSLLTDSSKYIDGLAEDSRETVHQYYLPLWLWHRLDAIRWEASGIPLRESKRGGMKLDVDHVVAVKLWDQLTAKLPEQMCANDAASQADPEANINSLGNCCLLEKTFNISKGATSLRTFLERVHEFKTGKRTLDSWAKAMGLADVLVNPDGMSCVAVRDAVAARTAAMKTELKDYLAGQKQRADM